MTTNGSFQGLVIREGIAMLKLRFSLSYCVSLSFSASLFLSPIPHASNMVCPYAVVCAVTCSEEPVVFPLLPSEES